MSMEIKGSYNPSKTDQAEQLKEKEALQRAKEAKKAEKETDPKAAGQAAAPQDEYISSKKSGTRPTGLYRVGQDENGSRKIFYDDPKKAAPEGSGQPGQSGQPRTAESPAADKASGQPKAKGADPEESEEKCVGNTDKVEREIRKLKEKKQQLEQQIQAASGDEKKVRELEKKLAQVENELSQKDNDTYRRQNTVFTQ